MSRPLRQNGSIKEAGKFGPRLIQQHTYKKYYQIPFYQLPLYSSPHPSPNISSTYEQKANLLLTIFTSSILAKLRIYKLTTIMVAASEKLEKKRGNKYLFAKY